MQFASDLRILLTFSHKCKTLVKPKLTYTKYQLELNSFKLSSFIKLIFRYKIKQLGFLLSSDCTLGDRLTVFCTVHLGSQHLQVKFFSFGILILSSVTSLTDLYHIFSNITTTEPTSRCCARFLWSSSVCSKLIWILIVFTSPTILNSNILHIIARSIFRMVIISFLVDMLRQFLIGVTNASRR